MLAGNDGFCEELSSLPPHTVGTVGGLFRNMVLRGKEECVQVGKKKMDKLRKEAAEFSPDLSLNLAQGEEPCSFQR